MYSELEVGLEERVEHAAGQASKFSHFFHPAFRDMYTKRQHCEDIASTQGYPPAHNDGKPIPSPNVLSGRFVERGILKSGWGVNQSNGTLEENGANPSRLGSGPLWQCLCGGRWPRLFLTLQNEQGAFVAPGYPQPFAQVGDVDPSLHL